jgi:hypothetical protein
MDPSAAEQQQITSLALLLDWVGLVDTETRKVRVAFLAALGNPKMVRQVVAVPLASYGKAMAVVVVKDKSSGTEVESALTPVEEGQVGEVRRISRLLMKLAPESSTMAQPPAAGAPTSMTGLEDLARAVRDAVKPPSKKIVASRILDQCDDTEVMPLDAKVLADLIQDWKTVENDGEEPTEEEEATGDQLASLNGRIQTGATPFVDFGVWRPYGARMGRALRFVVHTVHADGVSRPREVNGPSTYVEWLRCWRVFAFAMVALKHASKARLQRYADLIRVLAEDFPSHWWIVGLADIKMRSEGLERVRRDCVKRHDLGSLTDFNSSKPWDVVFREAALDTKFWDREVDKQVVLFHTNVKSSTGIHDIGTGLINLANEESHASASHVRPVKISPGAKKRANKRMSKAQGAPKGSGKGGNGAGKGAKMTEPGEAKTKDGRFLRSKTGEEICWAYNKGTCSQPCPMKRWHMCEWCRQVDHTTKDCPKNR